MVCLPKRPESLLVYPPLPAVDSAVGVFLEMEPSSVMSGFRIADLPYEQQSLIVEQMPLRTMARLALTHADWAAMVQRSLRHGHSWAQSYADHRCCHDLTGDARAAVAPMGKWARKGPLEPIADLIESNAPLVSGVAICRARRRRERLQLGRARREHGRVRRVGLELGLVQLHAHLEPLLPRLVRARVRVRVRLTLTLTLP